MKNSARNAILGAILGDSLGVPFEFKAATHIPAAPSIEMVMPPSYPKTYPHIPYGTWSDDGSQLLCLLHTLLAEPETLNLSLLAEHLLAWRYSGRHQAGGAVFDVGLATDAALRRLKAGIHPRLSGGINVRTNGNGALMRVLPAALMPSLFGSTRDQALSVAHDQGLVTHRHVISRACCVVYTATAIELIGQPKGDLRGIVDAGFSLARIWAEGRAEPDFLGAIKDVWIHGETQLAVGTGYVVDTLWSAIWALGQGSDYVGCVRAAIGLGGDTDTTGCVTGGLAGIRFGLSSVPDAWWSAMLGLELVPDLARLDI